MRLAEPLFKTLQGEGVHSGIPTIFIRLAGCNLSCQWCDTKYSWLTTKYTPNLGVAQVGEEVLKFQPQYQDWVCITGGEPLLQEKEVGELVTLLTYKYGLKVEIFTNSSLPRPQWYTKATWCADIKMPSSGVPLDKMLVNDWFKTRIYDQVKFVVGTEKDLDIARDLIHKTAPNLDRPIILVSPVIHIGLMGKTSRDSEVHPIDLSDELGWMQRVWNFCVEEKVRFSVQVHKIVWGNQKGV